MTNKQVIELIANLTNQITELKKQLKPSQKQKFYSYKEAAEMLCITVDGLKSRIKRGQMLRITNNNRPLVAHSEIMRFLGSQNPDGGFGSILNYIMQLWLKQIQTYAYLLSLQLLIQRNGQSYGNLYGYSSALPHLYSYRLQVLMLRMFYVHRE